MDADPLLGATVGDYQIQTVIGSGGFGQVYGGVQPLIGKPVAIKVLHREAASDRAAMQRFIEEARAVNAIRHRGIVDIFGFGSLPDGRQYLVMELLQGDPLDRLVAQRAPMFAGEALPILKDVAEALTAAHGMGIVHRDLKPSNVFVVRPPVGDPYAKLLDFGLAKRGAEQGRQVAQTQSSLVSGTPEFMAPEQAVGGAVSGQTDLYALGVIAFEMLSAHLPYPGTNMLEILNQHVDAPVPHLRDEVEGLPEGLDDLIFRLMQKAPEARPRGAAQVSRELAKLLRQIMSEATRLGATAPAFEKREAETDRFRPARRLGPGRLAMLGVGGIVLAAGSAVVWSATRPNPIPMPAPLPPLQATAAQPSAPPEPVAPPPPREPEAQPKPEPVSVPAPVRPAAPRAPSTEALVARIQKLRRALDERTAAGAQVSPLAKTLLDSAEQDALQAKDAKQRQDVARTLDEWVKDYGR